ncbi:MAG TPA: alpha/beta fold hydrolase [Blastocatellia bacterium]|nr:alpha/beta fold hydrolase [Blastocatellia bacterium]
MDGPTLKHDWIDLDGHRGSYALLSPKPHKETAIVFVHGYGGDSIKTWLEFQFLIDSLADEYPWYSGCDLFFYKYDGISSHIPASADSFLAFIRDIFPIPRRDLLDTDVQDFPGDFQSAAYEYYRTLLPNQYKHLVLVGHSIGGVVLRMAIWTVLRNAHQILIDEGVHNCDDSEFIKVEPLLGSDLCLFAPANLGVNFTGLLGVIANTRMIGTLLINWLRPVQAAYSDLSSDLPILDDVRKYTEEYSERFPSVLALRARVLWATTEKVVVMWQYKWDGPVEYCKDVTHTEVCKPTPEFRRPLEFVSYAQQRRAQAS